MLYVWDVPVVAEVEDIVDVLVMELRARGSHLLQDSKRTSGNLMLTCINHKDGMEETPGMGILTEDRIRDGRLHKAGTVNCFVCGYTADLAEFVSNCFGHDDRGYYGHKWIMENFVNLSVENRSDIKLDMSRNTRSDAQKSILREEELDSYRVIHPYMYERMLTDRVIEYFDVGYDRRKDCLTFPVHDLDGDPIFMQRRSIKGKQFLNDVTTLKGSVLYGLYHVYKNLSWIKELYVTESIIDALTLWTYRKAAVATMQAIPTSAQIQLLRSVPIREICNAQDMDKAGDDGAARIKDKVGDVKLVTRADFPYKDINKLAQEMGEEGILSIQKILI